MSGKILIKNLRKESEDYLQRMFSPYGKIVSLKLNSGANECELIYETKNSAEKACAEMDGKLFLNTKVTVVLVEDDGKQINQEPTSTPSIKLHEKYGPAQTTIEHKTNEQIQSLKTQEKKELLGEIIYPLAKISYSDFAPKLTGMIVEAILKLKNDEAVKEIISSKSTIDELIHASYEKLSQVKAN